MSGETEQQQSGWTVDTLKYHTDQRFEAVEQAFVSLRVMLDERYQTQTKATDAAFAAQQTAMGTAFTAADKAVQTALLSAKEATNKAETASDKRFEATNEFREQLADQAAAFMPRTEHAISFAAMEVRLQDLQDRANRRDGESSGIRLSGGVLASTLGAVAAIVIVVNLLVAFATR